MRKLALFVLLFVYAVLAKAAVIFFIYDPSEFHFFSRMDLCFSALTNSTDFLISLAETGVLMWMVNRVVVASQHGYDGRLSPWFWGVCFLLVAELAAETFVTGFSWPSRSTLSSFWWYLRIYAVMMAPVSLWAVPIGEKFLRRPAYRNIGDMRVSPASQ